MRLKRLELFGFKSFADRTTLSFPEGLTGIVGPNGCGKSNVVDAVRWALGETRPTSMRGGEMTDVIFKGSTSRPALGLAEVTLVLDNSSQILVEHGSEVSVTRRVHKSGEGEYEIDGARVRLKDVKDLLFDTGLGSRGYSVLEQGKIDAVLSANPLERRTIFEEAAGVSRYRQRRKETESRLKRVDADTERLDDVLGELTSRVRSLKIQAGKAERWIEARDRWRIQGTRFARYSIERMEGELQGTREQLETLAQETAELRERRVSSEADVRAREAQQETLHEAVGELSQEAAGLLGDLRTLDERAAQLRERAETQTRAADEEQARIGELEGRLAERRTVLEAVSLEETELSNHVEHTGFLAKGAADTLSEAAKRYREARERSEEQSRITGELLHEKTAAFHRLQGLEQRLEPLAERVAEAEVKSGQASERTRAAEAAVEERSKALGEVVRERAEVEAEAAESRERLEEVDAQHQQLGATQRELELEVASGQSQLSALEDWEREREGLEEGAQRLLGLARGLADSDSDPVASGYAAQLDGVLADHVRCESRLAPALDACLGERARALVAPNAGVAASIGAWIEANELGRAEFVYPIQGDLARRSAGLIPGLVRETYRGRLLGALADEVEVRADLEGSLAEALDGALLVTDREAARELDAVLPGRRFVTLGGEVLEAGHALLGAQRLAPGPVARRVEADAVREALEASRRNLDAIRIDLERIKGEREVGRQRVEAAALEGERVRRVEAELTAEERSARERLEDALRQQEEIEQSVQQAAAEQQLLTTQAKETQAEREELERRFALENGRLEELEAERAEQERSREEAGREETRVRIEQNRLVETLRALVRRREDLGQGCADAAEEIELARSRGEKARREAESGLVRADSLGTEREELEVARKELDVRLTEQQETERAGRAEIEELRRASEQVTTDLETRLAQTGESELERQRCELQLDEVVRRLAEDFELDRQQLFELVEADSELAEPDQAQALENEVSDLKRQLDKLGPVNLEAVNELEEVDARLTFLTEQRSDLAQSRTELLEALEKINSESERLFAEAFEEIRSNFKQIFRLLFAGGKADIELEPDKPLLEAGIEIQARPPGRETLPIGLLSGGQRTMTALALLFSVFQARPSPFCILDEVDAALDDANVARFLGMLSTFLGSSQFVVVTHNKGTMSACDLLHGVTMETKGVSKTVHVQLADVDDFVPEATGSTEELERLREEQAPLLIADPDGEEIEDEPEDTDEPVVELQPVAAAEGAGARKEVESS